MAQGRCILPGSRRLFWLRDVVTAELQPPLIAAGRDVNGLFGASRCEIRMFRDRNGADFAPRHSSGFTEPATNRLFTGETRHQTFRSFFFVDLECSSLVRRGVGCSRWLRRGIVEIRKMRWYHLWRGMFAVVKRMCGCWRCVFVLQMLSVVSVGGAGGVVGGMDRLHGGGGGRELAAQRDRQVRLHSVHHDLQIDLPPSIRLPDGEEIPYGSSRHLRIRDAEQVIHFFKSTAFVIFFRKKCYLTFYYKVNCCYL